MSGIHTYRLDAGPVTIVFAWEQGLPGIIHLGRRLPDDTDLNIFAASREFPLGHATLDEITPVSLLPEAARGFSGHPGLIAHRADGSHWAGQFTFSRLESTGNGVVFYCVDEARGLALELKCSLDPNCGVAVFTNRLVNTGDAALQVDWLAAPVIPVPQHLSQFMHFHGRWCGEFAIDRLDIPTSLSLSENRRGRTSHEAFPGTILVSGSTDEEQGDCLATHLAWSGNHRRILERLTTGECQLQMGVLTLAGEEIVAPGGFVETPELHVAFSDSGLNAMSQKLHAHIRSNILSFPDPKKPRPVTVNTWEALYFNHDLDRLKALADAAADVGAERYVLDDGWFKGRNDDTTSLGDWVADPQKYPDGLHPIVDYVLSKGLEFGLWVEPEMVNPDSDLYRAHPDWVLQLAPYPLATGRNQLVLNLTNVAVTDYLFEKLSALLSEYRISYLKWDMNRNIVLPGDAAGCPAVKRQTLALYALLDRLRLAFPKVEIESCASGGGRIDYEILKRTDRFWTSDSNDALERMRIQSGFSYFFPPEIMGAHIGPAWCHTSGRGFHPEFRALVASYGHMGLELDLTNIDDNDFATFKQAVLRHKEDRDLWHRGRFFRIRTVDDNLIGAACVNQEQTSARLIVTQLDRPRSVVPPCIRVPGLDPARAYLVTLNAPAESTRRASRRFDNPLAGEGLTLSGAVLGSVGVQLPVLYAQTALAIDLEAV